MAKTETRTVMITGTSSGIGRASAKLFAEQGWNVVATTRNPERAEAAARAAYHLVRLELEDRASIEAAVAAALERFGRIDVLVNNAGYGQYGAFEAQTRAQIVRQFEVNVFGAMDMMRAVLPSMRAAKAGVIVNVSSGAGIYGLPLISLYCASKFALEGFTEAVSYELAAQGIVVKLVEPYGGVDGTAFQMRADAERGTDPALSAYDAYAAQVAAAYARLPAVQLNAAIDVARKVFEAATDGTEKLRYFVGHDTRGFLAARRAVADDDDMRAMRAKFAPPA